MLGLNAAMLPAILWHGGHHFSSVPGGLVTIGRAFGLAIWMVRPKAADDGSETAEGIND